MPAPVTTKSGLRAEEYRTRAEAAAAAAAVATLQNIRDGHLQAAAVWRVLADAEQARTAKAARATTAADRGPNPALTPGGASWAER